MQGAFEGFEEDSAPIRVAGVIVDADLAHLDRPLDYEIPDELADRVEVGVLVRVRLAGRRMSGWVLSVRIEHPIHRVNPIEAVVSALPLVTPEIFAAARRISDANVATLSQTLSVAVPARHASTEKAFLEEPAVHPPTPSAPSGLAWADHPAGPALLRRLGEGDAPRAVWTALGPTRDQRLIEMVWACASSGKGVLLIAPTAAQAEAFWQILSEALSIPVGLVDTDSSPAQRYRCHLEAMTGRLRVLVGTRSTAWTPMKDLGLIIIWDDGDDRLRERRAPRCDALDVAITRVLIEGCALVLASYSRSVKAQSLVSSSWAVSLTDDLPIRRSLCPTVRVLDDIDAAAAGDAGTSRIPPQVTRTIRESLENGPVLVHVASAGYVAVVSCQRCRAIARCPSCQGPLQMNADGQVACAWCSKPVNDWRCRSCSGTRLRNARIGSERTGEEIARAIPGAPVLVSSSTHQITREIPNSKKIVVATAGAEPRAEGGYAGIIILDARAIAGRAELWAPEEALRRWFNALSLARAGAPALIAGGVEPTMAQAMIRFDPADYAQRLLDERVALGFFPAKTLIAIDGEPRDVTAAAQAAGGELIGTLPLSDTEPTVRALVRVEREERTQVLLSLASLQAHRSSRKLEPLRISVNPPELF